jgi:hypothetical protein
MRARLLSVLSVLLFPLALVAQVPENEKIPISDPDVLASLGFPRDATNVFVWSKASFLTGRPRQSTVEAGLEVSPDVFGTSADGYTAVQGYELEGDAEFQKENSSHGTYCGASSTSNLAWVHIPVPHGVQLEFLRWWAYDNDADDDLRFNIYETCQPKFGAGSPSSTFLDQVETSGSPGNVSSSTLFSPSPTTDTVSCAYEIEVQYIAGTIGSCVGSNLAVQKLRFQWKRQISPAPATATFADVPTSYIYFRAIEALAASGITSGCGGGNFCPNGNVTRGELAAFLARALGLHWP